jgi:hypothetical protein
MRRNYSRIFNLQATIGKNRNQINQLIDLKNNLLCLNRLSATVCRHCRMKFGRRLSFIRQSRHPAGACLSQAGRGA